MYVPSTSFEYFPYSNSGNFSVSNYLCGNCYLTGSALFCDCPAGTADLSLGNVLFLNLLNAFHPFKPPVTDPAAHPSRCLPLLCDGRPVLCRGVWPHMRLRHATHLLGPFPYFYFLIFAAYMAQGLEELSLSMAETVWLAAFCSSSHVICFFRVGTLHVFT